MRKYEIGFIINPEATEDEVKKIIDSVVEIIKRDNGTIEKIDEWGRRRFAYPIEKHKEGIYTFISADFPGHIFSAIERRLKLHEKVMRFVALRLDERLRKANRLTKKWKKLEKFSRKNTDDDSSSRDSQKEVTNAK